jgi:hypothetical protein
MQAGDIVSERATAVRLISNGCSRSARRAGVRVPAGEALGGSTGHQPAPSVAGGEGEPTGSAGARAEACPELADRRGGRGPERREAAHPRPAARRRVPRDEEAGFAAHRPPAEAPRETVRRPQTPAGGRSTIPD